MRCKPGKNDEKGQQERAKTWTSPKNIAKVPAAKCRGVPRLPKARFVSAKEAVPSCTFLILANREHMRARATSTLLGAKGIATRSKNTTRGCWPLLGTTLRREHDRLPIESTSLEGAVTGDPSSTQPALGERPSKAGRNRPSRPGAPSSFLLLLVRYLLLEAMHLFLIASCS